MNTINHRVTSLTDPDIRVEGALFLKRPKGQRVAVGVREAVP